MTLSKALRGALLALLAVGTPPLWAAPNLGLGITSERTPALRLTLDRTFDLSHWHSRLDLRLASGVLLLPGDDGDDNAAWVITPAFRYHLGEARRAYVEAGIGAALFLNTRLETRQLSTAFQFEDRLALGWTLPGASELSLSVTHYSNGRIKRPNDGFEVYGLTYRLAL
ncbi:acyloxyacyl hydrolase [Halomonas sp. 328]|uniref:acyloxyacyl hydrolase n=1 Tax=Halomonas sp. 328 TaxID=2776704 RepID=UPI0018A74C78|nr:acyloxyacyl hydrolase [Halomonas sp. 328]MBF8223225.1 acyloxyacyl hydrolase [Halomonas sp. 328]